MNLLQFIDPAVYVSLTLLFGIAAQFRAMDGYSLIRRMLGGRLNIGSALPLPNPSLPRLRA